MRIKLDENIPAAVKHILSYLGHHVETVMDENLVGSSDLKIWEEEPNSWIGAFVVATDRKLRVRKPEQ